MHVNVSPKQFTVSIVENIALLLCRLWRSLREIQSYHNMLWYVYEKAIPPMARKPIGCRLLYFPRTRIWLINVMWYMGYVIAFIWGTVESVWWLKIAWRILVSPTTHDDVIKWEHFPRNWSFVRGIHRSPLNSPHKGQWRGALMFSLICAWIND